MRLREILGTYNVISVRVGHVVTNNLSNELDSLTVILTNIPKINIQSYDIVEFTDENDDVTYWLVANIEKTFTTFKEPFLYEYVVDLISPTKLLEIPIPSHTITNVPYSNRGINRFCKDAVDMYFKLGGRYKNINVAILFYDYGVNHTADNTTINKFINYNNGHAPECTFEKPTLREFLDYLFGFLGYASRAVIEHTSSGQSISSYRVVIYPMNLNFEGNEINSDDIVEIKEQMRAENYITTIENNMDEVISPTTVKEYLPIKCEDAILNDQTTVLLTQYKMYDVKSFKLNINTNNRFKVMFHKVNQSNSAMISEFWIYCGYTESQLADNNDTSIIDGMYYEIDSNGLLHPRTSAFYELVTFSQDGRTKLVYRSSGATDAYYYNEATQQWNALDILPDGITNHRLNNYSALVCRILRAGDGFDGKDVMVIPTLDLALTNHLVINEVYQSLERVSQDNEGKTKDVIQNNSILWERGSYKIMNLLKYETRTGLFGTQINGKFAIVNAIGAAFCQYIVDYIDEKDLKYSFTYNGSEYAFTYMAVYSGDFPSPTVQNLSVNNYLDLASWIFEIEYTPYTNFKIRCSKDGAVHKITSMDSNTNISTDVMSEIKKSKEKIKQLANSNLILQGFSTGSVPTMKVGDYKILDNEKYTLISLETRHDGTANVYKGIMSKNYSNYVINTIINREKRYYSIPDPSSSVIRHEKIEMHITGRNTTGGYSIVCNEARVLVKRNLLLHDYAILPCTMIFSRENKRVTYTVDMKSNSIYAYAPLNVDGVGGKVNKARKYTDDYGITDYTSVAFGYISTPYYNVYGYRYLALPLRDNELPTIDLTSSEGFVKDSREHLIVSLDLIIDDDSLLDDVDYAINGDGRHGTYKFNISR